jgi:hypothetical protein
MVGCNCFYSLSVAPNLQLIKTLFVGGLGLLLSAATTFIEIGV